MVKFLKWKKILVMLGIIVGIGIITSLTIRWPINTFPVIEGKILDATTGEPIENVLISVDWIRSSPGPAGEITRTIKGDIVVTDKEGKYRIPRLWSLHLFSVFSRGYMGFYHPLYGSKQAVVAREKRRIIIGSPALKAYPEEFEYKDGIIHYGIELLSLEEKYVKAIETLNLIFDREERTKKTWQLSGNLCGEFGVYENGFYWRVLVKERVPFDVNEIFKLWDKLAAEFPQESPVNRFLPKYKERITKSIRER